MSKYGTAMSIPDACREIEWKTAKWTAKGIQLGCLLSSVPDIRGLCFALWLVLLNAIVSHGPWSSKSKHDYVNDNSAFI